MKGVEHAEVQSPVNGETIGRATKARPKEVREAIAAARKALPGWRALSVEDRAKPLLEVARLLREAYGNPGEPTELKLLISKEVGKRLPEADVEVAESADMIESFATEAPRLLIPRKLTFDQKLWPTKEGHVIFEPVGVVAVIKPWNYPLELPLWAIGPALIAGNTVVFKSSEIAPLTAAAIGEFFVKAGLPGGVLNIVPGDDATGRYLVQADGIDMVSFTGSVEAGREIAVECGKRLRRYSLELGGNDPAIVLPDADLELAANGLIWGAFANSGQVCVRPKRVFIHGAVLDRLVPKLVERTRALRPGVEFGPLASEQQLSHVEDMLSDAVSRGAKVIIGGHRIPEKGNLYFEPTIITGAPSQARILREECFGPVLPIIPFETVDQAIRLANGTPYGLGASIWTSSKEQGERIAGALEAGMVWINDVNVAFPQAPWGGVKQSGPGVELGEWGIYEFTVKKHVNVETSKDQRRTWWYPYQ